MNQSVLTEDIKDFVKTFEPSAIPRRSKFLITGATGLIGSVLSKCLLALNNDIHLVCPVRSLSKAESVFENYGEEIEFVECDLISYIDSLDAKDNIAYIIHCASPTNGKYMTENPVDTFELAIESTRALLKLASRARIASMVYVSSLEYYGQFLEDTSVTEDMMGIVDRTSPRSSYPLGKQAAEFLCIAYAKQYGVDVKVARLTQTFGAGVSKNDSRVFAQFARSVINGENIVLHTDGGSAKPYCYTIDAVSGILTILLKGEKGEAYNVANEETYISIRDMAEFLRVRFNPGIAIVIDKQNETGYAPFTRLRLSARKISGLGWQPRFDMYEMFRRLIDYWKEN